MRQVTQNYKTGAIRLEQVEPPSVKSGGVLVRTHYSVISAGTEGMKVREGKLSFLGKARARPDQVKKVLSTLRQQGVLATYQKVMNKLDTLTPLGYSISGEVVAVGEGAEEFHVGQRVAAAGAGYANHADINFIPKNLVTPVPDGLDMQHAAFATVGAIALHGFRRAEMQLGESAVVIGLGLLGQLLVQILRAAGVHVIGVDVIAERCQLAQRLGAKAALAPDDPSLLGFIGRLTSGNGADGVFLTVGGSSNAAVELAVQVARDRARVIDIGKTRLDLPWNDYYLKELDVKFSRSYGPGRYDPVYEERGVDYPIGYVRWTEKRNLASFLDLAADGRVQLAPLITATRSFDEAEQVYQEIAGAKAAPLGLVFDYGVRQTAPVAALPRQTPVASRSSKVRIAFIGAGNYASTMLLPHLASNPDVALYGVATQSSLSAQNAVRKFGFRYGTTDYTTLLADENVDAVLIATRHSSHARFAAQALRTGKTVYVEKPLGLDFEELRQLWQAVNESHNARLMVGFNRRFSPLARELAGRFPSGAPAVLHYRVHAGQMERGSWYLDPQEGSRFIGEAGHFFDLLSFLVGARPLAVSATALRPASPTADDLDNVAATVQYEQGSIGNLLYLTQGGASTPKERLELFTAGRTAVLDNFESITEFGREHRRQRRARLDKGQKEEMASFVRAAQTGEPLPIPLEMLFDTTMTTLAVRRALRTGRSIALADCWQELAQPAPGAAPEIEQTGDIAR